jgi:hypothetical protein
MFDDIGLMETGNIIWAVLKDNYGSFLPGNVCILLIEGPPSTMRQFPCRMGGIGYGGQY